MIEIKQVYYFSPCHELSIRANQDIRKQAFGCWKVEHKLVSVGKRESETNRQGGKQGSARDTEGKDGETGLFIHMK